MLTINAVAGGDAPRLPRSMIAKFSPPTVKGLELKIVFGTEAHMYNDISCDGMQLVRPEAVYIGAEFHRFRRDRYCFLIENCSPPPKPALMFKRLDGCDSMLPLTLTLTLTLTRTRTRTLTVSLARCDSMPYLMIAMRGLARFHARWWANPNLQPRPS